MATTYSTPGVYIEEKSSFGSSVVAVATAVPAFIGYTEMASRGNKSLLNEPTKISSMGQFEELFGGPPPTKFNITMDEENEPQGFKLELNKSTQFNLYYAMRFYFSNGGGDCYIVSVGGYDESIEKDKLNDPKGGGLASLEKHLLSLIHI